MPKLRLNERNVNLFTNCKASESNFNNIKIDSIDDKPSAIQACLKIAEVRRR